MRPPKIVPLLVVLVLKRHVVKAFIYSKHATHNIHKREGWGRRGTPAEHGYRPGTQ